MVLRMHQARQFALLLVVLSLLSLTLVACQTGGGGAGGTGNGGDGALAGFKTPNPLLFTPTPTFPPATIGAWPSNYSPQNNDTVTIYVLCRTHLDITQPPQPCTGNLPVHVQAFDPINKSADGQFDQSGLAAVPISFSDPASGKPVRVDASTTVNGKPLLATTYFTPNVTQPPTPTPGPAPTSTP